MVKKTCLIILLFLPFFTLAQSKLPGNIYLDKLPNGLEILVVEDNSVPLATVMMSFKCGAFTEQEKFNGLTGLYQGMLERGNKEFPTAQDVGYYGGALGVQARNSSTSEEYST